MEMHMNINQASKITGISKKALRFYEEKGLFRTERQDNSYRDYTQSDIDCINKIKALRSIGVSISDILLMQNNILSLETILKQRVKELEQDRLKNAKQLKYCNEILSSNGEWEKIISIIAPCENSEVGLNDDYSYNKNTPVSVGIDIGTSTLSVAVINYDGTPIDIYDIPNDSRVKGESWEHLQDPDIIVKDISNLMELIYNNHTAITSIGITGQMHGVIYIDEQGNSLTPLHTWLDKSADIEIDKNSSSSYSDAIYNITGLKIPTGYGIATHYYLQLNNMVPINASKICSIMDYVAIKLTNTKVPFIHSSIAASFGGFDIESKAFSNRLNSIINTDILPDVVSDDYCIGFYKSKIPVYAAIGDHQAGCFGVMNDNFEDALLLNIGTGSQISAVCNDTYANSSKIEVRPYVNGKYIKCYSALCGGLAYALMEKFISSIVYEATGVKENQYLLMERIANNAMPAKDAPIVETTFCGTRHDPNKTGNIFGITIGNFNPGNIIIGIMRGMIQELYEHSLLITNNPPKRIIAIGNAVRKNRLLQNIIFEIFSIEPEVAESPEEVAVGVALYSLNQLSKSRN